MSSLRHTHAAIIGVALLSTLGTLHAFPEEVAQTAATDPVGDIPCLVEHAAVQTFAGVCDSVVVTSTIKSSCHLPRLHVVFVSPQGWRRDSAEWIEQVSHAILRAIRATDGLDIRVALVEHLYDVNEWLEVPMTSDLDLIATKLHNEPGHTGIMHPSVDAIELAIEQLEGARSVGIPDGELVILFAQHKDSVPDASIMAYRRLQQLLHGSGATALVGCPGTSWCNHVRDNLVPPRGVFEEGPQSRKLASFAADYAAQRSVHGVDIYATSQIEVSQSLELIDSNPPPDSSMSSASGVTLTWHHGIVGQSTAFTRTLLLNPRRIGVWPVTSTVIVSDTVGRRIALSETLQVARTEQCVRATNTPGPTPTPTPTVTPEPTQTRMPEPLWLPIVLREEPCSRLQPLDVAVVLDTSSSMLDENPTKLSRATWAISAFVRSLEPADHVSLVTFDSEADIVQPLTGDHALVETGLWSIETGVTTRIDLGIESAREELMSPRSRETARKVMIVLTDGKPNPVGSEIVLTEATKAKANEVTVFTIGLGADVDENLLMDAASSPSLYFNAPGGEDLEGIYLSLLSSIPCDPSVYWAER